MGYTAALHARTNISQWYIKSVMPGPTAAARAGTLYVVATPIGNLDDITLRALRVLKAVSLVAAEDTRRTGNLLRHFDISTPVLSVHEHNERRRSASIVSRLASGQSVALVTDAGTPAVSDPGAQIVQAVRRAGFAVEPIPGPSAVLAALSAAGLSTEGFAFLGFPPSRSKARSLWLSQAVKEASKRAVVFFEAPHRLRETLAELSILGECHIFVCRELTKVHEELVWGTPAELDAHFDDPRGEFTLVIPQLETSQTTELPSDADIAVKFGQMTADGRGSSRRDVVRQLANELGMPVKAVYASLERYKLAERPIVND
jgi:16S rRNA (cytidine1402-2'-O)-methyltransferase